MTTTYETYIVADDAMPLDLLVWRRFRKRTPDLVERILEINRDLADLGQLLPVGTSVIIPIDAPDNTPARKPAVRLWGSD